MNSPKRSTYFVVEPAFCMVITNHTISFPEVLYEKSVLRNFTKFIGKHLSTVSFLIKLQDSACKFIKKETLTQVFSCKLCKISKNTFFHRAPMVVASKTGLSLLSDKNSIERTKAVVRRCSSK